MYQFNYQHLRPYQDLHSNDGPIFSCIVPTEWLQKNLPTMGGDVVYSDRHGQMDGYTNYVFEFSDEAPTECRPRAICLNIHRREAASDNNSSPSYHKLFAVPARIHCSTIKDCDANDNWCFEVVLLNHFFGTCALSASLGNIYLDFDDVIAAMSESSEFVLEFGVGKLPQDILPGILERLDAKQAKSVFGMLFNKTETMRLAYLDELIDGVSLPTGDPLTIVSDAAVIDDRMLISILVGR